MVNIGEGGTAEREGREVDEILVNQGCKDFLCKGRILAIRLDESMAEIKFQDKENNQRKRNKC